ncbi:uncharacterized protein ACNLHF_021720 [Anomaloglossus baeobatrachus]|uniref:uncharacterized protein LOC142311969 n=1 Tax=Anomaloglossus baeobatrachus TaxID=238106 RepID=UPI003F4F7831
MEKDRDKMERIIHLTLEILFRLTKEDYIVVKTSNERCQAPVSEGRGRPLSPITGPPPHPLIHEDINDQKILELIYKMIELLTGEVPIRSQDVTIYFSMEEWEYLEGHKDQYKEVMMDVHQPLTSPVLSRERTTPERCPRPLLPQDSEQEIPTVPQDDQCISRKTAKKQFRQLFCKVCNTLQDKLSIHLCQSCMKTASEEERIDVLEEAKRKQSNIIKYLTAVPYNILDFKNSKFEDPNEYFADFLERRGCTVLNKPSKRIPDCEVSGSSGEKSQFHLRKQLSEAGLQLKHDIKSPMLTSFKDYLRKTLSATSVVPMVDNVAKFLYYVSPKEITLDFIKNFDNTMAYFDVLSKLKTAEKTMKKYIGNVRRLVIFLTEGNYSGDLDEETKSGAKSFLEGLKKIEQGLNEKTCKPIKRGLDLQPLTNTECCQILKVSKKHVTSIFEKASLDKIICDNDKALVGYYLRALLILKHRRRPSVSKNLTVKEWLQRKQVHDHDEKTFTAIYTGYDVIIVDNEEEQLFSTYFEKIRPTLERPNSTTMQKFFLSLTGQEVKNPTKDLERFHNKYNLPLVTWQMTISAYEHWADEMSKENRSLTDEYVYYGELNNQLFTPDLVEGMKKLAKMEENREGETSGGNVAKRARTSNDQELDNREGESDEGQSSSEGSRNFLYQRLTDMYPVDIATSPPSINLCKEVNRDHAMFLRKKWIFNQKKLRVANAAASFRKPPSSKDLARYVKGKAWRTNVPYIEEVKRAWKPPMPRKKTHFTEEIKDLVRTQKWKGLIIMEDSSKGGHTVKTVRAFNRGEVVCDYHGEVMDGKKAENTYRSLTGKPYMYFFGNKGYKLCINATNAPCNCHPDMPSTFGRMINHSCKMDNLKPKVQECEAGETPTILFFAKKDLKPGTELFFDYGVVTSPPESAPVTSASITRHHRIPAVGSAGDRG